MKKRLFSLLVCLCLLLGVLPVSASAATISGSCGKNVRYRLENGVMTISGTGAMDRLYYGERPWEDDLSEIRSVVVKEGVTTVGSDSFKKCDNLSSVTLPSTLKAVQERAFWGCSKLTSITLPNGLEELWEAAFSGSGITSIVVPDSVTLMRPYALGGCKKLTTAVIGKGVTEPYSSIFESCSALESVTFRGKLKYVSDSMFYGCKALKTVTLPNTVTAIQANAFRGSGLTEMQVGSAVTEIGEYAFAETPLEQIVLPQGIKTMGDFMFYGCKWLASVDLGGLRTIPQNTFTWCRTVGNITVSPRADESARRLRSSTKQINYLGTKSQWERYFRQDEDVIYDSVNFDDHAHRYAKGELTNRNCEEYSFYPYVCKICGNVVEVQTDEKSEHVWGEYQVTLEPTCTEQGEHERTCTVCGVSERWPLPALDHDLVETVLVEPTYYTTGRSAYHCSRCDYAFEEDKPEKEPFIDVAHNSFCRDAVIWAIENGVTTGVTADCFQPNSPCTRGQAVTFLWRSAGKPEYSEDAPQFEDVGQNRFCYDSVCWAVENGVTKGMDGVHFAPDTACTRGQIVTFLWRSAGCPEPTGEEMPFQDVKAGSYCETAVQWAVESGITKGVKENQFQPNAICNRGQIVTFLYRYENAKGDAA